MSEVVIREADMVDALQALENSSFADRYGSRKALSGYMVMSERTYVGAIDDEIVCVWGVMRQSLLSNRGYLWLFVTEAAEAHKFLLLRYSQRVIEHLLDRYHVLVGECSIGDSRAQKWMKFLGATFSYPEGEMVPFQIVGKHG